MKILDTIQQSTVNNTGKRPRAKKSSSEKAPTATDARIVIHDKPASDLSRSEILSRLKNHKEGKDKVASLKVNSEIKENIEAKKKQQTKVEGVSKEGQESVEDKDHLLASDVGANDPKAPETQEKLKDILKTGAFKFSEKERKVLSSILN